MQSGQNVDDQFKWPLPPSLDDAALQNTFLQTQVKMKKHSLPD